MIIRDEAVLLGIHLPGRRKMIGIGDRNNSIGVSNRSIDIRNNSINVRSSGISNGGGHGTLLESSPNIVRLQ